MLQVPKYHTIDLIKMPLIPSSFLSKCIWIPKLESFGWCFRSKCLIMNLFVSLAIAHYCFVQCDFINNYFIFFISKLKAKNLLFHIHNTFWEVFERISFNIYRNFFGTQLFYSRPHISISPWWYLSLLMIKKRFGCSLFSSIPL